MSISIYVCIYIYIYIYVYIYIYKHTHDILYFCCHNSNILCRNGTQHRKSSPTPDPTGN